jgi:hypothetical protein
VLLLFDPALLSSWTFVCIHPPDKAWSRIGEDNVMTSAENYNLGFCGIGLRVLKEYM